jgi:poly-gamma-glutamate biosynthesis protein PgsC/CapC
LTVALSVGIGLIVSFVYTELTGLLGGGLVVPGYLALYMNQPARVVATLLAALGAYAVVWALSNAVILYGRRRFAACILAGFWIGWAMARAGVKIGWGGHELRTIGYIVPGLIASDIARQGVIRTVASVILLSTAVRLILILAGLI